MIGEEHTVTGVAPTEHSGEEKITLATPLGQKFGVHVQPWKEQTHRQSGEAQALERLNEKLIKQR